ncbi:transporter substrate-binding domain-containing protein [Deferribacter autotrophicus]|uniref:histidine kinase n=1 Tax=Deferribacter autotrophicus TaxID=500465 RepID=A0A5A8F278_9BACT|nr:transporter substrate-binding domain-containing protein [Deferribacter autotrophicus]KAA0257851.1 transporter substrate-binding domain-containing protein [Deferribacter autotrophicus]
MNIRLCRYLIFILILFPSILLAKELKIYYTDYEPFIFRDYTGELRGLEYDIISSFCKANNLNCSFIESTFSGLINAVKYGYCDLSVGALYKTKEREQIGLFSTPYLETGIVAVVPYNFNGSINELYNKKVGVKRNATGHEFVLKLSKRHPYLEINVFDSTLNSFKALEYDHIDWLLNDYFNSLNLIYTKFRGKFKIISVKNKPLFFKKAEIAFFIPKKNKDLKKLLDLHILKLKTSGELDNLIDKWFYITKPVSLSDYISIIIIITVLVASLIFFILVFFITIRTNKKLRGYNSLLKAMIDIPSFLIFTVNKNKEIRFWNKGAELITGFSITDIHDINSLIEDDIVALLDNCIKFSNPMEDNIINIKTKSGFKTILFDIYPVFNSETQCLFFGLDLTETIQSINSKLLYENLYFTVVENSPNGILMIDEKTVFINKTLQNWLGYDYKVMQLNNLDSKIKDLITNFMQSNNMSESFFDMDNLIDNKILDIYLKKIILTDKTCYVALFLDNTLKVKQQRIINEIQKDEIVSNIVNSVVHDMNNILSVIINYASILKIDNTLKEEQKDIIKKIIKVSEESSTFLKSLLNISRISNGKKLIFIDNFLTSKKEFFSQIVGKNIKFNMILHDKGVAIELNEERFTQTLLNLILNARDAIEDSGEITLKKYIKNDKLIIEISDTGKGIPEDLQNKIFEPFFTTKGEKGTGLGLYAVKIFINEIGGSITFKSKLGLGTTFRLSFPIKKL